MVQGVNIPLTMTDQTKGAVNAARNNVKRLSMEANRASQSISRTAVAGQSIGRAGGVVGQVGSGLGSAAGGRLGAVGGALGGILGLGPLGIAIGGAVAGLHAFTKSMEETAETVRNQLAGERAMRDARERGMDKVRSQQQGAAGRLGVMQQASALGISPEKLASGSRSMGVSPEDAISYERARSDGMSEAQLYAAYTVAQLGMASMSDALKAAKSLGRNATAEDVLLRARGRQLTGSAREAAATEIRNVQSFRGSEGVRQTLSVQRGMADDALTRDISAIQSGATAKLFGDMRSAQNDPLAAEAEKALDQLRQAYSDAYESHFRLYKESSSAARTWQAFFGSETRKGLDAARTQFMAAQAQ